MPVQNQTRRQWTVPPFCPQLAWIVGVLALLWVLILNKRAQRLMCDMIGRVLEATTFPGDRHFHRMLEVGGGYSVCEHPVAIAWLGAEHAVDLSDSHRLELTVLAVPSASGDIVQNLSSTQDLEPGDALILYATDGGHEALEERSKQRETETKYNAHRHSKCG